jgi:hypothetical protein
MALLYLDSILVQWTASGTHTERLATVTGRTILDSAEGF